jgi:hypothetical protein
MKTKGSHYVLFTILGVIILGIIYTACKDITPEQETVENKIELKLVK